jgi:hypothetical protein
MSGMRSSRRPPALTRAALALYPPAWRARYGAELAALMEDSGGGLAAALGVALRAIPAWLWPPRHLHDPDSRMRASLGTVMAAGAMLTGVALVFAQLTQLQGLRPPGHPMVSWSYAIFDVAMVIAGLAAAAGGVPLWLLMLRRARREHRSRDAAYLLLPVAVPAGYWAALTVTVRLVGGPGGVSGAWFLVCTLAGFAAAGLSCAGPILALRRLRPRGPAVRFAARAAGVAAGSLMLAAAASAVAATGLCLWARDFAGYHQAGVLTGYLGVTAVLAVAAVAGAARGVRATLGPAAR